MSSPTPVALPADFMNQWASVESSSKTPLRVPRPKSVMNPFSDVNESSSITASGFTDTTLRGEKSESVQMDRARRDLENSINMSENLSRRAESERRQSVREGKRRDHGLDTMSRELDEITDTLVSGARQTLRNDIQSKSFCNQESGTESWIPRGEDQYVTMADFTKFAATMAKAQTIHPSESASNVGKPLENIYGFEPLNIKRQNHSIMTPIVEDIDDIEETVIGGYTMSPYEKMMEVDSYSKVTPVQGLPVIFTNSRLNFLTHVHSPLFRLLRDSEGNYPARNCLEVLLDSRKDWGNEPAMVLLETVLDSTIDQKSGVVKANPFNIPIIEPTMLLDSRVMYMALDQLHREFEIEWFNTMKFVTLPIFQSKYDSMRFTGVRKRERRTSKSSSGESKSTSSSSRVSNSRRSSRSDDNNSILSRFLN